MRRKREQSDVYVVTDVGRSRRQDIDNRQRSYIIKMLIRTACLVIAIVLFTLGVPLPFLLVFVIAATVLPWLSVVSANAGQAPQRRSRPPSFFRPDPPQSLRAGREDRKH